MNNELKSRMAQYEQELLRMRSKGNPKPPAAAPSPAPPTPPPPVPPSSTLAVRVVSAENGMPITGAIVTIDRRTGGGKEPIAVRFTDKNGDIAALTVAAGQPNTVYDLTVAASGFFRQTDTGIVADGTPIRREIRLLPLPEL